MISYGLATATMRFTLMPFIFVVGPLIFIALVIKFDQVESFRLYRQNPETII